MFYVGVLVAIYSFKEQGKRNVFAGFVQICSDEITRQRRRTVLVIYFVHTTFLSVVSEKKSIVDEQWIYIGGISTHMW